MKFVTGEPALLLGKTLAISDVHIGIEHEFRKSGIRMPSQTGKMLSRLLGVLERTGAERLMICGDLKHKVPGTTYQEEREVPEFLENLLDVAAVELIPGNHDADSKALLPPKVKVHTTAGVLDNGTFYSHGHTWPPLEFAKASVVVIGHVQPQIEIKDKLGYVWREPVWVRVALDAEKVREKYGVAAMPELVILPSFNRLAGGLALNKAMEKKDRLSPVLQLAKMGGAGIYLLDGTFLGLLERL